LEPITYYIERKQETGILFTAIVIVQTTTCNNFIIFAASTLSKNK